MTPICDTRGQVVRRAGTPQTSLTPPELASLIEDYRSGAGTPRLAEAYGIHRSTVSAHLTRRGVARRPPGLGTDEAAEAVRLHEQGLSLRAIARVMGVGRRPVTQAVHGAGALASSQSEGLPKERLGSPSSIGVKSALTRFAVIRIVFPAAQFVGVP